MSHPTELGVLAALRAARSTDEVDEIYGPFKSAFPLILITTFIPSCFRRAQMHGGARLPLRGRVGDCHSWREGGWLGSPC